MGPTPPRRQLILFVENDWLVAAPAIEILRDENFEVIETGKPSEALKHLDENPAIDLVILDVGLPEMNGNRLLDVARAKRPHLKALFVTGYDRSAVEFPIDSITRYIAKPYLPGDLLREASKMLQDPASGG